MRNRIISRFIVITLFLAMLGCSTKKVDPFVPVLAQDQKIYGTSNFVWEQPMVDIIDVPPGLDPEGIYYRPAHREVVEIRQGRWRYYLTEEERNKQ